MREVEGTAPVEGGRCGSKVCGSGQPLAAPERAASLTQPHDSCLILAQQMGPPSPGQNFQDCVATRLAVLRELDVLRLGVGVAAEVGRLSHHPGAAGELAPGTVEESQGNWPQTHTPHPPP